MSGAPNVVGRIATTITHLEMLERPTTPPRQPPRPGVEIVRALEPTVAFYRFLYDTVGHDWVWTRRRMMPDDELLAIIRDPATDLRVLWQHGVPAGFAELDQRDPEDVELAYFGLMPDFIGKGLGGFLLDWTVRHAFHKGARRLWVHTCDLDHPRALATYEAGGFEPFDREEGFECLLDGMPLPAHARDREILPPA